MSPNSSTPTFNLTLHATDPDNDPLTWSISNPATHGAATTASGTGDSNVIGFIPTTGYLGLDNFIIEVSDGILTTTITVNVNITLWRITGSLMQARASDMATLLPNGQVLVVGGYDASAELYDPFTGTWTNTT